jgi:DNA-binding NarL/FixJ family response regulator
LSALSRALQEKLNILFFEEYNLNDITNMMLVEDNLRARQALTAFMSLQTGIKVSAEASNGLEAINLIQGHAPDIVVMDAQMPVMDGLEATKIIKKNWPQIKIVVLTMYPNYQPEAMSAGADAFLVKGCSADEIVSKIHSLSQAKEAGLLPR